MRVYRDDQKFLTFRINALLWTIVGVFVFLACSFWVVQGVQAEKYRNLSDANALREIVSPAKRGLILDRTGQKILADNQPSYSLTLDRVIMRPIVKIDPAHREKVVACRRGRSKPGSKKEQRFRTRVRFRWPRI